MTIEPTSEQTLRCGAHRVTVRAYSGAVATVSEPGLRLAVGGGRSITATAELTPAAARQVADALRTAADIAEDSTP